MRTVIATLQLFLTKLTNHALELVQKRAFLMYAHANGRNTWHEISGSYSIHEKRFWIPMSSWRTFAAIGDTMTDIEMRRSKRLYVNGYPSLAAFIASDKEQSASVYRSYRRLTSRNLLYLEAELFELERQLDEFDEEDLRNGDLTAKQFARDWSTLSTSDDPRCVKRRKLMRRTRAKIKEYRKQFWNAELWGNKSLYISNA